MATRALRGQIERGGQPEDDGQRGSVSTANSDGPQSLRSLLALCARYMETADLAFIRDAYEVAAAAHAGTLRRSGEPFIEHPIAVAAILAELAMDAQGIAAALLHDTVEDTRLTLDDVKQRFGPTVAEIVDGVTKFAAVEAPKTRDTDQETANDVGKDGRPEPRPAAPVVAMDPQAVRARKAREYAETVQKLFLAMMGDPRVVLLKLADRLHNMRTMAAQTPAKREQKSREVLELYAPLAGRIGLYVFKSELEDLAFSFLQPEEYQRTVERLRDEEMKRAHWAKRMCERMQRELAASGIQAAVNWRLKHPYRAYVEAQETGTDVALLHDVIAFRVLVNEPEECYAALGIIHSLWHPYGDRIRDYIASPKVNGYRSLHTAVFALDGRLAQMHIRTHAMHRDNQHGVAAYWLERAETGQHGAVESPVWLAQLQRWVEQLRQWQQELRLSASEFVDVLHGEVFKDQVFVFTPKGDVRELPAGATVLDLAYRIHTDIGTHASGALVQTKGPDGLLIAREVALDYLVQTGDVVRVITDPQAHPRREWLTMVATRTARERINRYLRRAVEVDGATRDRVEEPSAESTPEFDLPKASTRLRHPCGQEAQVSLARCCFPCPGDEIAGVVERGRRVTVHRACCRTLRQTLSRRAARGAAHATALPVRWPDISFDTYCLPLAVYGRDYRGLMHEISACVARMGLNVYRSSAIANQDRYKAAILLILDMKPGMRRETVMRSLASVQGVTQVERDKRGVCDD